MESRELTDRLDVWAGRREPEPARPPSPRRRGRPPKSRARPLAAALLVGALAAGWLVVGRHHDAPAESRPPPAAPAASVPTVSVPPTTVVADTARLRALLGAATGCVDVQGPVPEVSCVVDHVRVDARLVGTGAARKVYASAAGGRDRPRRGPPACASGHDDERAWSRPAAPRRAVGRYRCRIEGGRAALWWTDDYGIVAHAVAADHDLAPLFAWWRAHVTL